MFFTPTEIDGVWIIDPAFHEDNRGRFSRSWCLQEFSDNGIKFVPVQANMGYSTLKGTLRGLHFQIDPAPEAKLVRCTRGAMFDVAVDLRPNSASYGRWVGVEMTPKNGRMLYIPESCAHGYQSLENETEMYYMTSQFYSPDLARGARYNDVMFGIRWPLPVSVISDQDRAWPKWC